MSAEEPTPPPYPKALDRVTVIDLVTLEQAKYQVRILPEDLFHDADLAMKITAGSAIVMDYLKLEAPPDSWWIGDPPVWTVPPHIQQAALIVIGELFFNREASVTTVLSDTVMALLERSRDPALA